MRALDLLRAHGWTTDSLCRAHAILLGNDRCVPSRFRDSIAWVDGASPSLAKLIPPPTSALHELMHDLLTFTGSSSPTWFRQAIAYYQFLHIHPFSDGNGRMSRLLVASIAGHGAHDQSEALAVAIALTLNRVAMTRHFDAVRDGDIQIYLDLWHRLAAWAAGFVGIAVQHEQRLQSELMTVVGPGAGQLLTHLCSAAAIHLHSIGKRLNWSSKILACREQQLRSAGWITGASNELTCPPINRTRVDLMNSLRTDTARILASQS
ncbi:Fic family protein [Tahibacter amnicola]|uniref:Fic family protein n=1 Tax=Tahibacter amnicola TaxID=2976241 RepID=A0ABY6BB63_9GAMM|nr:Fic family protein [Tahibacter amnicola]UXI67298.1 Fic family protein [Tahibacter amnicola]